MPTTPTPEQIQYMQEHIGDTLVPSMHISNGIMVGAATISVVMRFMARKIGGSGIGKDDICLFGAYALFVVYSAGFSYTSRFGEGQHVLHLTNVRGFAISTIVVASIYVFGMAFVKYSILFLYARIFPTQRFRCILWAIGVVVTSWAMAAFFGTLFNCYPINIAWDSSINGRCIDYGKVTLVIGIFNILLDFAVLVTPMPKLWKLQMSTRRKLLLSLAFAAGSMACIVSIARLFYASNVLASYDPTWDDALPGILSGLEICTGIVACCAVTYRPLIERIFVQRTSNVRAESQTNLSGPADFYRISQELEMRRTKQVFRSPSNRL